MSKVNPPKFQHRKTDRIIYYAKKGHRSDIKPGSWSMHGYHKSDFCEKSMSIPATIDYLSRADITPKYFLDNYDSKGIPCVISGAIDHWPASKKWDFDYLEKEFYRASFKVGEDDDGHKIKLQMKYFIDYIRFQEDDSPLYLFDGNTEDRSNSCSLINDWDIIDLFPFDLHAVLGDLSRPPYRWFCVGPKRSGTTLHEDPLSTAAWNALIKGHKWWVLIPPHINKKVAQGHFLPDYKKCDEAILWFDKILPQLKDEQHGIPIYEIIQRPGDIIFVPPGWWHAVLNLSDSISCTQNFVSYANFIPAWKSMRKSRPKLAAKWINRLKRTIPPLFEIARELNSIDGWYQVGSTIERVATTESEDKHSESSSSSSSSSSESSEDESEINHIRSTLVKNCDNLPDPYRSFYRMDGMYRYKRQGDDKNVLKENQLDNFSSEDANRTFESQLINVKKPRIDV